jgi:hypothetical protein
LSSDQGLDACQMSLQFISQIVDKKLWNLVKISYHHLCSHFNEKYKVYFIIVNPNHHGYGI